MELLQPPPNCIANMLTCFFVTISLTLVENFPNVSLTICWSWGQPRNYRPGFFPQPKRLKPSKATALDKINARLLKDSIRAVAPSSTMLFNSIATDENSFFYLEKCEGYTPVKKGDRQDPSNYRPISILPSLNKIIERAVYTQFYGNLTENNLISKQFGFRPKSSTVTASAQFIDQLPQGRTAAQPQQSCLWIWQGHLILWITPFCLTDLLALE